MYKQYVYLGRQEYLVPKTSRRQFNEFVPAYIFGASEYLPGLQLVQLHPISALSICKHLGEDVTEGLQTLRQAAYLALQVHVYGTWVIHGDLHSGNVLTSKAPDPLFAPSDPPAAAAPAAAASPAAAAPAAPAAHSVQPEEEEQEEEDQGTPAGTDYPQSQRFANFLTRAPSGGAPEFTAGRLVHEWESLWQEAKGESKPEAPPLVRVIDWQVQTS